jgi:peptidoglycan/xylan/chitin deacetylase (PgdA/CDA1 family)
MVIPAVKETEQTYKVYLTFDDGPSTNTEEVLDVLISYNVKATFFVIGQTGEYETSLYKRIISEGHSLALHSYSHNPEEIYSSLTNYIKDFERLIDWIFEVTQTSPKVCRMVGGSNSSYCSKSLRSQILKYFEDNGYTCYDWDIDPHDSGSYALASSSIADNIIKESKKKPDQDLVILMHDDAIRKTLADSLDITIPYFIEQGYVFDVLDVDTVLNKSSALVK